MYLTPPQPRVLPMRQADTEMLDYSVDVSSGVPAGDSIVSAAVSVAPSGTGELVASRVSAASGVVTFWLAEGQPGRLYTVRVEIVTAQGRTFDLPLLISVGLALSSGLVPPAPSSGFSDPVVWVAAVPMGLNFARPLTVSTVAAS